MKKFTKTRLKFINLDIDSRQRKIDGLRADITSLQHEKYSLEENIRNDQAAFDISDKEDFNKALAGMDLDAELRDALEYISNPIANSSFETAAIVAVEAAEAKLNLLKEEAASAYALEEISAEQYYNRLIELELQRALVAKYALGEIEKEQDKELQRLRDAGKSEEELLVYEKRLLEERVKANKTYYESYQSYQDLNKKLIDAGYADEGKRIDESIQSKEDEIEEKENLNNEAEASMKKLAEAEQEDLDDIDKAIKGIERSTRNWAYTTQDAAEDLGKNIDAIKN